MNRRARLAATCLVILFASMGGAFLCGTKMARSEEADDSQKISPERQKLVAASEGEVIIARQIILCSEDGRAMAIISPESIGFFGEDDDMAPAARLAPGQLQLHDGKSPRPGASVRLHAEKAAGGLGIYQGGKLRSAMAVDQNGKPFTYDSRVDGAFGDDQDAD